MPHQQPARKISCTRRNDLFHLVFFQKNYEIKVVSSCGENMNEISLSKIESMIYLIRGHKVVLDSDLATLYGVEIKRLNEQVKRNQERFPDDFMFQLSIQECDILRSQFATFNSSLGSRKYLPFVFTENGVAMLSSVLHSKRAIQVNISIMRIFTKLRSFLMLEGNLSSRMGKLEEATNKMFRIVFERLDTIEDIVIPKLPAHRKKIGLKVEED